MGTGTAGHPADGDSELRSRLAAIVEFSTDAIISETLDGVITSWNAGASDMYGYAADEMIGRNISELIPPDRADELASILGLLRRGKPVAHCETRRVRKDGAIIDVSISASPVRDASGAVTGAATVARDITERNRAEAERRTSEARMHQSERMETVGQLAGGIAHDFNNLLGAITGYAELVADATADNPAVQPDVQQIQSAAHRAAKLTRELLMFSRREPSQPEQVNLNAILAGLRELLSASVGGRIAVRFETAAEVPAVLADRGQVEQVLLNLAVNARDAMPHGGTLTFTTGQANLTERDSGAGRAGPGSYVTLTVTDTGHGMNAEIARRAFEPFFTTKPLGQGTGLGLSTVHGIVTQAGGRITVGSEEGKGTAFHVYLPAITLPAPAPRADAPATVQGSGENILVVDDEPAMLAVTARILRRNGYHALEARTCAEALSLMSSRDFHLLLTDSVMPTMSGPALAHRALELKPGLRILHMSGSIAGVLDPDRVASGATPLIRKPFTSHDLLEKVHTVLCAPTQGGEADVRSTPEPPGAPPSLR